VPKSVKGGLVRIELTNRAKGEHGAQLVRAEQGHSAQEALKAAGAWGEQGKPLPSWVHITGGLGDVDEGKTSSVTQELAPGRYVVAAIETDANAPLEITGGGASGGLPSAPGRIEATEYAFAAESLEAGANTVLFDNMGTEPHFIAAAPIKPGKTLADVRGFVRQEKGEPPIDEQAGFSTAVLDGGERQTVELELRKGRYALLCFVPDRKGGTPHVAKGMVSEAVVR